MAYVPAGSLCPYPPPQHREPAPLVTVPGLSTAGAVRAWSVHCDGLLQIAAIGTVGRVTPERGQGHRLVRFGQRLTAVPFHGAPCIGDTNAGHDAKTGGDDEMGDLS